MEAKITIDRNSEIVWSYFTETRNWEKWWGGVKNAKWDIGGKIEWALGGSSPIETMKPGKMIKIAGGLMSTMFTFDSKLKGKTIVSIEESSPKGGAFYNDGGASRVAQMNKSLVKLKEHIESETKQEEGNIDKWWKFWK